jgi:hypothetical protein
MKRILIGGAFALAMLAGAGCQSSTTIQVPTGVDTQVPGTPSTISTPPVVTSTAPIATSTKPVVKPAVPLPVGVHADWKTDPLFSGWTVQHPNTADKLDPASEEAKNGLILRVALGTAVQNPGKKSVPDRTMEVWKLKSGDVRLTECDSSLVGKQNIREVQPVTTNKNTVFCLQKSTSAGAGNLYNTQDYIFLTSDGPYVFNFTTHSVQCANFERPAEQCVAFDEKRDAALFSEIMGTVALKNL